MTQDARDIQLLRLLKAFARIEDSESRALILKITEAAARGASLKSTPFPFDLSDPETKLN